jgi:hypothetical protein
MKFGHLILFAVLFSRALAFSNPPGDDISAHIATGDSLYKNGRYEAAGDAYNAARKLDKQSPQALEGLARVAIDLRDWGELKDVGNDLAKLGHIAGSYYEGIGYRETGKFKGPLLRHIDFGKAKDRLQKVIDQDPTFRDVFLQRALIERHQDNYPEAIRWVRHQLEVKPGLVSAEVHLFRFFDYYIQAGYEPEVTPWLQRDSTDIARYFIADYLRRERKLSPADSGFAALTGTTDAALQQMLLFSRIRLELQRNDEPAAGELFSMAIDSISSEIAATLTFETCKYILKDAELRRYRMLESVAEKREFFQLVWRSRNPTPASPVNPRALEHFRRLTHAEDYYWDNYVRSSAMRPPQSLGLRYPDVYFVNESFNDRGLIYLRHGEPDDRIGSAGFGVDTNESWLYHEREDRPEYVFHFLGLHWELAPYVDDRRMLSDRVGWHSSMTRLARSHSELEFTSNIHEIQAEAREDIFAALSTDFHSWNDDIKAISAGNSRAVFYNPDGKPRVELYTSVPLDELQEGTEVRHFEHGAYVSDSLHHQIDRQFSRVTELAQDQIFKGKYIQRYSFELKPGDYYAGYYLRRSGPEGIGGENFELKIEPMKTGTLDASDLVLAYEIGKAGERSMFAIADLSVLPNPDREFATHDAVQLYYEVYNLQVDDDQRTAFEVSHILSKKGGKKLFGLFGGGDKNRISIEETHEGDSSVSREHIGFDVSRLEAGDYELEVVIRDKVAGSEVKRAVELSLEE